jgi:dTDP-4-dehydrorhamnose reductase
MKILLLGKNGQLGWELNRTLLPLGEVLAYDLPEFNLTDAKQLKDTIRSTHPDVILNATAYTNVDGAEREPELAATINATSPRIMAEEAADIKSALIHYSTDYVFDGSKGTAYAEDDIPNPLNTYGKTKLLGERAIQQTDGAYFIFRTSWVYSLRRNSFVTKILEWAQTQEVMRVVTDQVASPTWCRSLAEITAQVLATGHKDLFPWMLEHQGLYHLSDSGSVSRLELAQAVINLTFNKERFACKEIQPALTSEFPSCVKRPVNSALNCENFKEIFKLAVPDWKDTLRLALAELA